jgi:TonB family protein
MNLFAHALFAGSRFAIVLAINISLFLIIPATHAFLDKSHLREKNEVTQRKVVAELIKPKKKETKQEPKRRLRSVESSSSQSIRNPMKFKFSPDLSVAGGAGGVAIQSQELTAEVFEEGEAEEDVRPRFTPAPRYPDRARDMAIEGTVVVTFVVDVDGKVGAIEEIEAPHPSFKSEIRSTLQEWKFQPAQNKGVPVKQRVRQPFDFYLNQ